MLHKLPWKTIGLMVVVTLVVIAAVRRNFLGIGNLVSPAPAAQ